MRLGEREAVKSVVLGFLVLAAVAMNALLWLRTPGGGPPPRPGSYVAEGSGAAPPVDRLFLPLRVVVHRGGRHALLFDADGPGFRGLVAAGAEALAAAGRGPAPAPAPPAELAARRRSGPGWELVLPGELPAADWLAAWAGEEAARGLRRGGLGLLPVRRVSVFLDEAAGTVVYLEGGGGLWRAAAAPGGDGWPARLEEALAAAEAAGWPAVEASGRYAHLEVPGGLFVPGGLTLPAVRAEPERLDPGRLAASVFPDAGVVRTVKGGDGSVLFTDGQQGLLLREDGSVRYERPAPAGGRAAGPVRLLAEAAGFAARHGGWPRGARLLSLGKTDGGEARFLFAPAFRGHPLIGVVGVGGSGYRPPLRVRVAASGGIRSYERFVPGGEPQPAASPVELRAEAALAAVDRGWSSLFGGRPAATVTDLFPVLAAWGDASGAGAPREWRPAWAVALDGSLAAVVDAATGRAARLAPDGGEAIP